MSIDEKTSEEKADETAHSNFITDIIDDDLEAGDYDGVVTRFPPEPNGYLHIGHAKSIVLNHGLAQQYDGRFHLRFDDTNPLTEEEEYVESMKRDVKWLGADYGEHLYFASDYFERLYELAEFLIKKGKAYVDSLSVDDIRDYRGTLTEPGKPSPYRERSVEENLDLFRRMRDGEFDEGEHVLRAKIDMSSPNMLMRDPLLYRIRHAEHYRAKGWCIYPMYDYAHCLEDAFEGITHSICTLEFENNRELYDWVIEETEVDAQPKQIEMARLNLNFTVMSKRKLLRLVKEGFVDGWDDPRMPTISAFRRRGVTPEAIRAFCKMVGVAKANSLVDMQMLEYAIRDDLNMKAPRVLCVTRPLKVVITNYPEDDEDWLDADYFPRDVPLEGTRKIPFSRELYIERSDFREDPPDDYYRLAPGREIRLRYGYFITCEDVVKDDNGEVVEVHCTYDPETRGGAAPDGRKVKGTIHWVSAKHAVDCEVREYDRLFEVERPDADPDRDFTEFLNPESLVILDDAKIEPSVVDDARNTRYQFERLGYFWEDPYDSHTGSVVFNRIVSLRDSWAKKLEKRRAEEEAAAKKEKEEEKARRAAAKQASSDDRPNKRPASYERDRAREAEPELARRLDDYQEELGLAYDDADLLSGDLDVAAFFEETLDIYDNPETVAPWLVNELLPRLEADESPQNLPFGAGDVAALIRMFDEERVTNQVSQEVLEVMLEEGGDPETIVDEGGLERITDRGDLAGLVDGVLSDHPDAVERYRGGKKALLGFFIGQVMQITGGTADPQTVREILTQKLD